MEQTWGSFADGAESYMRVADVCSGRINAAFFEFAVLPSCACRELLACIDAIGLPEAVKDPLYCGTGFLTDAVAGTYIGISMFGFSYLRVQWKYTSSRIPRFD